MLRIGLTGGIGSGKSEVSARFKARGAVVIDADALAREVVEPGTAGLARVVDEFGAEVIAPDGSLDRDRLAALVFDDPEARGRLNAIVHPLVGEATAQRLAAVPDDAIVVFDIPLLVETGMAGAFDALVVVAAEPDVQVDRLLRLRGMTRDAALARIAAQAPLTDKIAVADYVIDNDGSLTELGTKVDRVWAELQKRAARTRSD